MTEPLPAIRHTPLNATPSAGQVFDFLTHPRRAVSSPQDGAALEQAARMEIMHRGLKLAAWIWGRGPLVLLLHGWESHAIHMATFVPPLLQRGFRVCALDAPCHGMSEGLATDAVDYGRAVLNTVNMLGMPHAVIGHSVGSAAALFAFSQGVTPQASVHLAGPSSMERVLRHGCASAGLDTEATQSVLDRMIEQIGAPLAVMDVELLRPCLRHRGLIMHDTEDREMPYSESQALAQVWPGSILETVSGVGHRRLLQSPAVVSLAVNFLAEPSRASASAVDQ